jgi:hypothetical protein
MIRLFLVGSALVMSSMAPALAGPCTQRIADLERTIEVDTTEGSKPAATDATAPAKPANVTAASKQSSEGLDMLKQAKELDKQGKEQECMDIVAKVATTKAPLTNK